MKYPQQYQRADTPDHPGGADDSNPSREQFRFAAPPLVWTHSERQRATPLAALRDLRIVPIVKGETPCREYFQVVVFAGR